MFQYCYVHLSAYYELRNPSRRVMNDKRLNSELLSFETLNEDLELDVSGWS